MTYTPILIVHIFGGVVAVLSGTTALLVRKGSRLHRRSGDVFVVSMLFMAASGAYVALMKSQPSNVIAGVFTFYLVASAWATVRRTKNGTPQTGRLDLSLMLLGLAAGSGTFLYAWTVASRAPGVKHGALIPALCAFGLVSMLAAAGDARMLMRGGLTGAKRLVRHIWRMGFALFIASGSFFLGTASDPVMRRSGLRAQLFTAEIRRTHLPEIPVILIVVLTIFWLCRVMFTKAYRNAEPARMQEADARPAHTTGSHAERSF